MPEKVKILIIDDLPEKLLVYQTILEELGEELVLARSAREGLARLLHDDFAVILLDVNMPEMDGFEAAAMIRARRRSADTPIIFITAYADELHAIKGYEHGAVDYILAPVHPEVLRTKVRVFVDLHRKTLQIRQHERALREDQDRQHQRELHESHQRLSLALQAGQMAAFEWRPAEVRITGARKTFPRAWSGGQVLNWSAALEHIFGFEPGEFSGDAAQLEERLHPEDRADVLQTLNEALRLGAAGEEFCIEHRIIVNPPTHELSATRSPSISAARWVEVRGRVVEEEGGGRRMVGVCMDITDRKNAQAELESHRARLEELVRERTQELERSYERLRLSDRMAAIGTLAAGLGHDMGNLLLPLRARLDSLENTLGHGLEASRDLQLNVTVAGNSGGTGEPVDQPLGRLVSKADFAHGGMLRQRQTLSSLQSPLDACVDDIAAIRTACEYLSRLSKGLRLFSLDPEKSGSGDFTDLRKWWLEVESFLRNSLPKGVALRCEFPVAAPDAEQLQPVAIAPHTLTQAVYNLVQNAGEAMRERASGNVVVSAALGRAMDIAHEHDHDDALPGDRHDAFITLTVADDGPGMTEETRQRCLEPFFTTKTRQISTGLGLALVRGAVYNAGGSIAIDSSPGKGTVFRLVLPIAEHAVRRRATPTSPPIAHIAMRDVRMKAFVESLLHSYGIDVAAEKFSSEANARVVVLEHFDAGHGVAFADGACFEWCDVDAFLETDRARRAVIIGSPPHINCADQVAVVERQSGPSQIRKALQAVLHDAAEVASEIKGPRTEIRSGDSRR